jgi:iron complex outermembrane recepter protein
VLLYVFTAFAQKTVKGKIFDNVTNTPLSGATVSFGGKTGTTTDKNGMFSIDCGKATKLTISFVGYETYQLTIKNCDEELSIGLTASSQYLDNVEISATSSQNKSLLYQPVSITKLIPTELKRGNGLFLDDAINGNVPGVTMNRRTVSGGQQFNIRGYGNGTRGTRGVSSNFDGQGYKVYLNGIPLTDAEGITVFDDVDYASISNVEVVKGPAGTLYGLAIAGAVNLSTVKAQPGKTSAGQEVMVGSYGLVRSTTQLAVGKEKSSVLINYGHQKTDGYTWHNKSKKDFVNFIGDFTPGDKQRINIYAGYSNSYDERFGELTLEQWQNNDYSGNPEYLKRNAHSDVITFRAGVMHNYEFTKNISNSTTIFGTGFQSNVSSAGGWTDKNNINYGLRSVFNTKFNIGATTLSGLTGVETQRQDAQVIGYNMKADPNDPTPAVYTHGVSPYWVVNAMTSNQFFNSKTTSLFTQWTLALPHDISLTAGVGTSNMKIELDDRFNPALATRPAFFEKKYTNMVSPHVAINKVFSKKATLYASYSKGYKAPVSSYFFITTPAVTTPATPATGRVNETLKPETGNQFEAGTKGELIDKKLYYELAYFYATFSNKMTAVSVVSPASPTTTLYSYIVNGEKQKHNGFEALVKFTAIQSEKGFFTFVRPFANCTISNFKYGNGFVINKSVVASGKEDYSNLPVAGVPKNAANIGVDAGMKYGLYANVSFNHRDKMPIGFIPSTVSTVQPTNYTWAPGYNLLNAKLGIKRNLGNHFDIDAYLGGQNLTNTKYYLMVFANQLVDAYIPAPRNANLFGGINLKYNF